MSEPEERRDFGPVAALQIECWEHDPAAVIARLDRLSDGRWVLLPGSRSYPSASIDAGPNRFTFVCGRCRRERSDAPLTVRGETLDVLLARIPNLGLPWNDRRDRVYLTRRMLTS